MPVAENLKRVLVAVAQAEMNAGRKKDSVKLIAVSKKQSLEKMTEAYAAGQRDFAENYLQEALAKIAEMTFDDIVWHFIGHVQSNKTRLIAENFAWVHGVDSEKIARRLSEQRPATLPPLNICIQVNIDHEANKDGVLPARVEMLALKIAALPNLKLRGLMAIPKPGFTDQPRSAFMRLADLQQTLIGHGLVVDTLSMGMSGDFPAAIAAGSTMVRVGTAIFGSRE